MEEIRGVERRWPEAGFAGKVRKIKEVLAGDSDTVVSRLLDTVLSGQWTHSSLYDYLHDEHKIVAPVLRELCTKQTDISQLQAILIRLCDSHEKAAAELWECFTDPKGFSVPFVGESLLKDIVKYWTLRVEKWNEKELCEKVVGFFIELRTGAISVDCCLSALALVKPSARPSIQGLSLDNAADKVASYLSKGSISADALAVGVLLGGQFQESINPLTSYLSRLSTNPYIPTEVCNRILSLFGSVLEACGENREIVECLDVYATEVVQFIVYETVKSPQEDFNLLHFSVLRTISKTCSQSSKQNICNLVREAGVNSHFPQCAIVLFYYWFTIIGSDNWSDFGILHKLQSVQVEKLPSKLISIYVRLAVKCRETITLEAAFSRVDTKDQFECWLLILEKPQVSFPTDFLCHELSEMLPATIEWTDADFYAYSRLCTHPKLCNPQINLFALLLHHTTTTQPHKSGIVSLSLISNLRIHPEVLSIYPREVLSLCTWIEPDTNALSLLPLVDYSLITPGIQEKLQQNRLRHRTFARLFLILFLESKAGVNDYSTGMWALLSAALAELSSEEVLKCNSPCSQLYKRKLYICQLLIALEASMPCATVALMRTACECLISALNNSQVFDLNVYMHRCLAWVVLQKDEELGPILLAAIRDVDIRPQAGSCLLLTAGKVVINTKSESLKKQLFDAILPFILSNNAQIRRAAQYSLFTAHSSGFSPSSPLFQPVLFSIANSKDCTKMRIRLQKAIAKFEIHTNCEIVLSGEYSVFDETFSPHFLTRVKSLIDSYPNDTPISCVRSQPFAEFQKRPMIIVASYLEKAANIAGLVRTCLNFSAQLLAIPNRLILTDAEFQSNTVGLHHSQPLLEVLPRDVEKFLAYHKANGYTVIGLEQAANSIELHKFAFPEKCVILLGFEKEGIPPDLIPMLDVCVEIPQFGLIRSLNVHVSAAICMKEYDSQWRSRVGTN